MSTPNTSFSPPATSLIPQYSEAALQIATKNRQSGNKMRSRKYSRELLDMAVQRASEIGLKAAEQETGVNSETIRKHAYARRLERKEAGVSAPRKANNRKYSDEVKRAVALKAREIRQETALPVKKAFEAAGRLHGVNGLTIHAQYVRGMFTL